ncbi:MAG: hypothetical protein IJX39_06245 [Clostridia bacterium]|nr:hypothetical protein [Clostridia bacterium]
MKRFLLLGLTLLLLLTSCSSVRRLERDAEGYGYTDQKSGIYYAEMDACFEPARAGDVWGEYKNDKGDVTRTFRSIPDLDPALFLTDEYLNVYYAGDVAIDASAWQIAAVLVCEEDVVSVENFRFSAGSDDATVAAIRALWFESAGDAALPLGKADYARRIKLTTTAYPNLFYCFSFLAYDSGEAYFYDANSRRTVVVPEELAAQMRPVTAEE